MLGVVGEVVIAVFDGQVVAAKPGARTIRVAQPNVVQVPTPDGRVSPGVASKLITQPVRLSPVR